MNNEEERESKVLEPKYEPKEHSLVVLTFNEEGSQSFTYVKKNHEGQKEIYYINCIAKGGISGGTMLLGQFISEFENSPNDALELRPGFTNRIYMHDKRIMSNGYNYPTKEETQEFINRMNVIVKKQPQHKLLVKKIIDSL